MNLLRILMIAFLTMFALSGCSDDDNESPPPTAIGGDNGGDDESGDDDDDESGDDSGNDDGDSGDDSGGNDDDSGNEGNDDDQGVVDEGPIAFNQFVIDQFDRDAMSDPVALNGMEFEFDNTDPNAFDAVLTPPSE